MTQLPKLFGVKGGGEHFFERIGVLAGQLARHQRRRPRLRARRARPAPRRREAPARPTGRARRRSAVHRCAVGHLARRSRLLDRRRAAEGPARLPRAAAAAARRGRRHPARVRVLAARVRRRRLRRPHAGAEERLRDRSAPGAARARRGEPGRGVQPWLPGRGRPVAVVRERQGRREDPARARVRLRSRSRCA